MILRSGRLARGADRPSGPFVLNRDSPQARGLSHWFPLGGSRLSALAWDHGTNANVAISNGSTFDTPYRSSPLFGLCPWWNADGSDRIGVNVTVAELASDFTLVWYGLITGFGAGNPGWFRTDINSFCILQGTGRPWIRIGGTDVLAPGSGPAAPLNTPIVLAWRVKQGAAYDWMLNGAVQASATGTATVSSGDTLSGGFGQQTGQCISGPWADVRWYNRALTDQELAALWEPATRWDLYAVPSTRLFFDVVAGGVTKTATLSAAQTQAALLGRQAQSIRSASQAQSAALAAIRVRLTTLTTATQAQVATALRQAQVRRAAVQTQGAMLVHQPQVIRSSSQASLATSVKQAQVTRATTQGQSATLAALKVLLRTLAIATQSTVATLVRQAQVARLASQAQTATMTRLASVLRLAAVSPLGTLQRQTNRLIRALQQTLATILSHLPGAATPRRVAFVSYCGEVAFASYSGETAFVSVDVE